MIVLCIATFLAAFLLTFLLTPLARWAALRWNILDHPRTAVKTHKEPVPYLGGLAIYAGIAGALLSLRWATHFPTGTLRSLRGLLLGGALMAVLGLIDDTKKPNGLSVTTKLLFQFAAAALLIHFDIRIHFIQPEWLADALTVLWVAGISNAINLIDIMDGLAASQAVAVSMGFLLISIPSEHVYVNVAAAAVAGAALAFIPHNMSRRRKIFMGDTGSLMLGLLLAGLSLGTSYTRLSEIGVFAPLLILGVPVYDTLFVSVMRLKQGKSPFMGSKDHLAQKLRAKGFTTEQVVLSFVAATGALSSCAYLLTLTPFVFSLGIVVAAVLVGIILMVALHDVVVH
ncbi:MAG: undecaprenyl/decaprenyl-phosphate alpha-N-acetylglucosaminyl 1-phosphate transferase [Elusimicrobia bacterium]|nr:undecaprenyl/decaprenyl-phosphate alpha-N-acetylglucosaminyl 1-phosphate transferase [Elusimicrobiota bacterium]MBK7208215.1 undecaprenyl/decaprenyl-phosphate alpha-N-acetylglucosaminyl 1-phosphate transferase [Elusimicrobiota bacterium]MBK7544979.1 undecaprenyl/decaprenyl-phosphate alpha-N-acetylglucosaminyl 1-phosphate transferase [Elusimicrobiota bacterium]MBK7574495.1 undecaprenyl/decaprenyl-phosphate alpha-N-acetylglucosaminyl 1-phosphate transferase [Elusimicrobiota bacterium]MBK768814